MTGLEGQSSAGVGLNQWQSPLGPNQGLYVGDPHNVPHMQNLDRMNSVQQQVCIALQIVVPLPLTASLP